ARERSAQSVARAPRAPRSTLPRFESRCSARTPCQPRRKPPVNNYAAMSCARKHSLLGTEGCIGLTVRVGAPEHHTTTARTSGGPHRIGLEALRLKATALGGIRSQDLRARASARYRRKRAPLPYPDEDERELRGSPGRGFGRDSS